MEILAYILGVFTTAFAVASMQFKNMKWIILCQILSNFLLGLQCIIGGTLSTGGCIFCSSDGSGEFAERGEDIQKQLERAKSRVDAKIKSGKNLNAAIRPDERFLPSTVSSWVFTLFSISFSCNVNLVLYLVQYTHNFTFFCHKSKHSFL